MIVTKVESENGRKKTILGRHRLNLALKVLKMRCVLSWTIRRLSAEELVLLNCGARKDS